MSTTAIIILVVIVGFLLLVALQFARSTKPGKNERVINFSGEPGAGKTFTLVERGDERFRKLKLDYKFGLIDGDEPSAWSSFPAIIGGEKTHVLKREHLLFQELLPENCVILISEFSEIASNLDYANPLVVLYLDMWIRLIRHFYNAYVFIDDQAFGQVLINIRRRTNTVYNLSHFRRWLLVTPFYKVNVDVLKCIEDTVNVNNIEETNDNYLFGFLPYKWMKKRKYNTRCYQDVKYTGFTFRAPDEWSDDLKTNYIIDLSCTKDEEKAYKEEGRKYALYRMFKNIKQGIEDCLELAKINDDKPKIIRYTHMLEELNRPEVENEVTK